MKHGSLISPDEAAFGFGTSKAVSEATSAPHGDGGDLITVPDAHLLFSGEFKHVGNDLKIIGEDGKSFLVTDYFKTDKHPTLRSPEGATLSGDLVDLLAGPLAPGQYAQAGAPQPGAAEAVGRVAVVTGNVTVIRNGVAITVNAGDAILKNDVVQTGAGATVGLSLNDGSTFNLTGNARLAINEFVYDPNGSANSSLTTLIQGAATFVAGQIAKTGDMKVATPVATMGIRGTAVILDINALDGRVSISVIDQRDNKEHNVEVFDRNGNLIATATSIGGRLVLTPTATLDVIASFTNKTADQIAAEFAAFQAVLSSYDAAKQFFPNLPDHTDVSPKGTQNAGGSDFQPSNTTPGLPDPITFGDKIKTTEVNITIPGDTSNNGDDSGGGGDPLLSDEEEEPTTFQFTVKYGTADGETIEGTSGNDFIYAGGGDDIIIAGHGGGNDFYDGDGDNGLGFAGLGDDTIKFESTTLGVTINLDVVNGVLTATADGDEIGHDNIINIENFVGGLGNDVFVLHTDTHWELDGGAGIDTIRLAGDLDIRHENGPDVENFEIVDLTAGAHIVDFDADGVAEMNSAHTIRVLGNSDDHINVMGHFGHPNGHWEFAANNVAYTQDGLTTEVVFDRYEFRDGDALLATAYVQDGIVINLAPEILWSPDSAITPVETPLYIAGMQFEDDDAGQNETFTFTVSVHHGSIALNFDPEDYDLIQVPVTGDDNDENDENTPLPYQLSFTGSLADINAALAASEADETGFIYTPQSDYAGPSQFTFTITDQGGASDTQQLAININRPPAVTFSAPVPTPLVEDGTVTTAQATVTVSDPDSDVRYVLNNNWTAVVPGVAGAQQYGGHYYAFFAFDRGTVSWTEAQNSARAMGGDLATITSAGENGFVFTNLVNGHVTNNSTAAYVGGSDVGSSGSWHWSSGLEGIPYFWNGSSSSYGQYTNWRAGEPNNLGSEHVLVMEGDGTWNNASDAYGNGVGYVVEFANYRMNGEYGYAIFNTADGTITYHLDNNDPDTQALGANSHVTDDFQIAVTDGNSTVNKTVSFAIVGTNDAPVTDEGSTSGDEDTVISVVLTGSDIEDALSAFRVTTLPANGTLYTDAAGTIPLGDADISTDGGDIATIYFRPDADWNGRTTLYYAAVDADGAQDQSPASYIIDVAPVDDTPPNQPPVPENDDLNALVAPDEGWTYNSQNGHYYKFVPGLIDFQTAMVAAAGLGYLATIADAGENTLVKNLLPGEFAIGWIGAADEDDEGNFTWRTGPEMGQVIPGDFWRVGEPNNDNNGNPEHYVYIGADGWADYNSNADGYIVEENTFTEDSSVTFDVSLLFANDSDPDSSGPLSIDALSETSGLGAQITFVDGSITYDPSAVAAFQALKGGEIATDTFTYTIFDGLDSSTEATVTVKVTGINDASRIDLNGADEGIGYETTHNGAYSGAVSLFGEEIDIADVDSANIQSATITASVQQYDSIFPYQNLSALGLSASSNTLPGGIVQITITGLATLAVYEQALGSYVFQTGDESLADRQIALVVQDADGATSNTVTSIIHAPVPPPPNDAPVIDIANADTSGGGDATTLFGLSVSDPDDDEFDVTIVTQHGSLSLEDGSVNDGDDSENGVSFHATLSELNNALQEGITYTNPDPVTGENDTDAVTLTISDQHGNSDSINFIFNVFGTDGVDLEGTTGKDVLFSTGNSDNLAGNGGNDTFLFSFNEEQIGSDTITDFHAGAGADMDKIFFDGAPFGSFDDLIITYNADNGTATIDLDGEDSITLSNFDQQQPLHAGNFIFA